MEVHVDKGMVDGQRIVFNGEGDQEPGLEPGDVIIVLEEKEHEVFKRSGNDLVMKMNVELVEALCGFQKVVQTLDDRDLLITSVPGEVVKPGEVKCVIGELTENMRFLHFVFGLDQFKFFLTCFIFQVKECLNIKIRSKKVALYFSSLFHSLVQLIQTSFRI